MSVTIVRTCDVCGKVIDYSKEQFWTVGVYFQGSDHMQSPAVSRSATEFKTINACRKCVEGMGIVPRAETKGVISAPPTIESLVRDIVRLAREDD